MATTISSISMAASVTWDATNVLDLSTARDKATLAYTDSIDDGTGADQAKVVWHDKGTIANGGSATIDVAGSLTDAFGNSAVFTKIKGIMLINRGIANGASYTETSGENIIMSTSTLTSADLTAPLEPGGVFLFTSPKVGGAVTATSADTITLTRAGSGTVTYEVVIWGLL
jgi:uncharacterized protein (DUF697 family)